MIVELAFLVSGIILGLSSAMSPGPLLTLVISETLKHGKNAGIKVAIAPLITDAPVIIISFLVLSQFSNMDFFLGSISLLGALFLGYLAAENIFTKGIKLSKNQTKAESLKKGVITNALNPHLYLFWFSVGAPIMIKSLEISIFSLALFILSFYISVVCSKIAVAVLVAKSRSFLKSNSYLLTIKLLGILLLALSVIFLSNSLKFFGILN